MSNITDFKCPCCGGYVEFDPGSQQFKCLYCGQVLSRNDLTETQPERPTQEKAQSGSLEQPSAESAYRSYHCRSCGAQIVTTATTAATRCYYCHNPVVLNDRTEGEFRPDGVIPFALDQQGAKEVFTKFIAKKKFVDHAFYSQAQLEDFSGVYYPYWMGDVEGRGSFNGEGTRVNVVRGPQYTVTTTKHYRVHREGKLSFRNLFRRALSSADRTLSEGIHPYRYGEMKAYAPEYLSGFMAEMRDIPEESAKAEMLHEVEQQVPGMMKQGNTYSTLTGNASFQADKTRMRYVLLPAWVLTWKGHGKDASYYYMMNGQTGEVCGKLPVNKTKLLLWCLGAGLAVFGLLCAGGAWLW
ncbi:MAG: TFIIB-type zinc ribbon-containing protein [Aristaeellaceae bacterium]